MRGTPKVYSTKVDFYNTVTEHPKDAKAALQKLVDGRFIWVETGEVETEDLGVSDDMHKVVTTSRGEGDEQKEVFVQMERVEDKNAEVFRMGWTLPEALTFINS